MRKHKNMNVLLEIEKNKDDNPNKIAVYNGIDKITYGELWDRSNAVLKYLDSINDLTTPILIYGHKNIDMFICILGCIKAGYPYVPIDTSIPFERIKHIAEITDSQITFATEKLSKCTTVQLSRNDLNDIYKSYKSDVMITRLMMDEQACYILFTSGSTGNPKGVSISYIALCNFIRWSLDLCKINNKEKVFINFAHFSFDMSVFDIFASLVSGGTLICITRDLQSSWSDLYKFLNNTHANIWFSTPSFMELCLQYENFKQEFIPSLELFLFCGEVLNSSKARLLKQRFPSVTILNIYGPTETTVAVIGIEITFKECDEFNTLPIGEKRHSVFIVDENDKEITVNQTGEIIIATDTVGIGYYKDEGLTKQKFKYFNRTDGTIAYGFASGDIGYISDDNVFFVGRKDLQVKLNGYRVELGDIEYNLCLPLYVDNSICIPTKNSGGKIIEIIAYVILNEIGKKQNVTTIVIRQDLHKLLPIYMIPKKIIILESFPLNSNGKIDRNKLR